MAISGPTLLWKFEEAAIFSLNKTQTHFHKICIARPANWRVLAATKKDSFTLQNISQDIKESWPGKKAQIRLN